MGARSYRVEVQQQAYVVQLESEDGTNRLTAALVVALTSQFQQLALEKRPIIITGNDKFFSAGADLNEISQLNGPAAYQFALIGQTLMQTIEQFPAPVYAAIRGYCMGGGLDLALACHRRICSPHSVFGHRGAALGLMTGWGGTQRLPRLIGKARALETFVTAEKISASQALAAGLVDCVSDDPLGEALRRTQDSCP